MEKNKELEMSEKYKDMVDKNNPPSSLLKDVVKAFIVGGLICDVGQLVMNLFLMAGISKDNVGFYVASVMVFLGALFTGLGLYDELGRFAGAGSIVPITGFSNSIVAPAMEFKKEGYVFGVGSKMFVLAGPVLVYGISSSIVAGLIYYVIKYVIK
jgi:stage V sporulation protein AC